MSKEVYRVTTKVCPTNMTIYYTIDGGTNFTMITADDVWGCDDYEEFQETIFELIEERVGFKLEEHERAWVNLDIQIWSNYFQFNGGVNMYRFSDNYTADEIERLLFNMLDIVTDWFDADYNDGIIKSKEELIQKYINIGMHKDEVLDMYDWLEEN